MDVIRRCRLLRLDNYVATLKKSVQRSSSRSSVAFSTTSPAQGRNSSDNFRLLLSTVRGGPVIHVSSRRLSAGVAMPSNKFDSTATMPEVADMDPAISSHKELYEFSLKNPEKFWGVLAKSRLQWSRPFDKVMECDMHTAQIKWFLGGKLNVTVNCVDRHAKKNPNKIALIWEKDEPGQQEKITYGELSKMVNRAANALKSSGVKKGDRVAIYMSASPMGVASMLACARIGAVHTVVFAGFSAEALASRIQDAGAETVITSDQATRGGRLIELKQTVSLAVAKCPNVKRVFVERRTGVDAFPTKLDIDFKKAMSEASDDCPAEEMESNDCLFMLYTSGSTGQPKGISHSQAGYLLYTAITHSTAFDYKEGDVFGCVADIGWITGHSYIIYGPLCNGATTVIFESTPVYPDPGRYWETVQRLRITHFYGAPTALRMLLKYGDDYVKKYDRSSLRVLGSVGEPINTEAWEWFNEVVGEERCPIIDTWWQTETGGVCIAPRPAALGSEIKPAMPMRPMLGIEPVLLDDKGKVLNGPGEVTGALCIRKPWPGMAQTLYGNHERFVETYFKPYPGYYFSGDGALRDKDGHYQITGRMDDVINISGHRLGTAEIEDVMTEHQDIAETAVVGYPHDVKGQGIYAYIVLKNNCGLSPEDIVREARDLVKKNIASYAIPERVQVCPGLPKTRSGKIMRRILRQIAADKTDQLGDISTLAEPAIVDVIIAGHDELKPTFK